MDDTNNPTRKGTQMSIVEDNRIDLETMLGRDAALSIKNLHNHDIREFEELAAVSKKEQRQKGESRLETFTKDDKRQFFTGSQSKAKRNP